jgi:hypothetical protein
LIIRQILTEISIDEGRITSKLVNWVGVPRRRYGLGWVGVARTLGIGWVGVTLAWIEVGLGSHRLWVV